MSEWPRFSLSELTSKIGSGATPRGGKGVYKERGIPLIRSMNVHDLRFEKDGIAYLDEKQASGLDNVIVEEGDVLLNITGASVARCCQVPSSMAGARVNQHVAIIRPVSSKLDGRFLAYKLACDPHKSRLLNLASVGATREALTKGGLESYQVEAPPVETQRIIADILGAYDDLIEVNRRQVAVLEEMARALFEEWFVRLRFPGHESVPLIETPDGPLPQGWTIHPLDKLCNRITDGAHRSPPSVTGGKPMASVRDMRDWGFDYAGCRNIADDEWDELARGDCQPLIGDIVIAKDGANLNKHTFLIWKQEPVVVLSSVAIIRAAKEVQREFLTATLRSPITDAAIKNMKSGAAIPRIVLKDFKRLPILWPSASLREAFESIVHPVHQQCRVLVDAIQRLGVSRDLLLPRLMSGQLSVESAERQMEEAA